MRRGRRNPRSAGLFRWDGGFVGMIRVRGEAQGGPYPASYYSPTLPRESE